MSIREFISDIIHNRNLYKTGKADRSKIVRTTVGWRRDPIHHADGYTETAPGEFSRVERLHEQYEREMADSTVRRVTFERWVEGR